MARKPTQEQLFAELLDRYGPEVAKAFLDVVDDFRSTADLQRLIAAIAAGNIEAAITALHLDAAAYGPLLNALQQVYTAGGQGAVATFPVIKDVAGAALVIRFDARNPRAEAWLRAHSSRLVTRILDDQRAAVRTVLVDTMQRGANPRTAGLRIVGAIDKATGRRTGGILGLSAPQERYVGSAREELASGDPAALNNYLDRKRRDKRFDPSIKRALAEGKPVPAEVARKAIVQYENRLLALRGETIGLAEGLTALQAAKHEAYVQAVERGDINERDVRRTWRDAGDLRVRHSHSKMDGQTVGLREPFVAPSGARLMYPGDTSLGAPASETVRCRCDVSYRIDFLSNLR
jgi:hypothetical protein